MLALAASLDFKRLLRAAKCILLYPMYRFFVDAAENGSYEQIWPRKHQLKTHLKTSCFQHSFFQDFGIHFGSPKRIHLGMPLAPFCYFSQDASKLLPRPSPHAPRRPWDTRKNFQELPKRGPRHPQDTPKSSSGGRFSFSWSIQIGLKVFSSICRRF